ncbi:lipase maturation factor 1-like [Oscarella lobularis]|uniref:lipase maturation factor 1-like n=1 Tax=Oscarella lobularis TaxID=121494 RepID=UPI0033141C78
MAAELRRRKREDPQKEPANESSDVSTDVIDSARDVEQLKGSYWLTRIVFLRFLAFIYVVAFLVAWHQNKELLGANGLFPADTFLNRVKSHYDGVNWDSIGLVPTLLWLTDYETNLDLMLDVLALAGLALAAVVLFLGAANMIVMTSLWILYHSIVNIGQRWYSFGWESQLLETGFLAIFLCPLVSLKPIQEKSPTSRIVIWGYQWLICRIMLGAGLIKIRGDPCWRELTCMDYHYETQPVPNPFSYYLHQSPSPIHRLETLGNHFIELVAPFFLLIPYRRRFWVTAFGAIQIFFQVVLIISGNLSFLNWLTIAPCIFCFDDYAVSPLFTMKTKQKALEINQKPKQRLSLTQHIRRGVNWTIGLLIAYLSIRVVQNLVSDNQVMNTSFDSLRIVNTYGAFGSITKVRNEVVFQGTRNETISRDNDGLWEEFEFKCKPGRTNRRPCFISPYHYRLDWLMWFAAFQNYKYNPWIVHLAAKFLAGDHSVDTLIERNPFSEGDPPRFVRAMLYHYEYTRIGSPEAAAGHWWKREIKALYLPPVQLEQLTEIIKAHGWKTEKSKSSP